MPAKVPDSAAPREVVRLPASLGELVGFFFLMYCLGLAAMMLVGMLVVLAIGSSHKGAIDITLIAATLLPAVATLGWMPGLRQRSVTFSDEALEVVRGRRRYRIPWSEIETVRFDDQLDEDGEVRRRTIVVRYLRDPSGGHPALPSPLTLSAYREWNKANFRSIRLPLSFPPAGAADSRRADRSSVDKRRIVVEQFLARGFPLS